MRFKEGGGHDSNGIGKEEEEMEKEEEMEREERARRRFEIPNDTHSIVAGSIVAKKWEPGNLVPSRFLPKLRKLRQD